MKLKEKWKLIRFSGKQPLRTYLISNLGSFGSIGEDGRIRLIKLKPDRKGSRYNLRIKGVQQTVFLHKEVAKAFVKRKSAARSMIIRLDHNYMNDRADNLKWVTPKEHRSHVKNSPNTRRSIIQKAFYSSPTAKVFNERSVVKIKNMIWDPKRKLSYRQIAEIFGVSEMQIYRLKNGVLWFHVRVPHEPLHKRYLQNLKNIKRQEQKIKKETDRKKKKGK
jgi:hypothetical protein